MVLSPFYLLGAVSRYPLYLFCHGLRFAPPATKKDAVSIGARAVRPRNQHFVHKMNKIKTGQSSVIIHEFTQYFPALPHVHFTNVLI
uniref:Secreted protein n=1 Tax=Chryseobacterium endophyticum TaxID=1854762 RepID=A0AAU6WRC1_9FLAO